jgi:hypothetical protein
MTYVSFVRIGWVEEERAAEPWMDAPEIRGGTNREVVRMGGARGGTQSDRTGS